MWLNLLLLMATSLVPYTVTVMGAFYADHNGVALNLGLFFIIALLQGAMLLYTHRRPHLLLKDFVKRPLPATRKPRSRRYVFWHDLVVGMHVVLMPLVFFVAYVLSLGH
jgi:hypothetical protein